MPYVQIRHKVNDFAAWKVAFDEHASMRQEAGSKGGYLFQSADDPNEVIVVLEWDDLQKARDFTSSDNLREVMQKAGVAGPPDIVFLEAVDRPSA